MKANEIPEKIYIQPSTIEQLPYQNIVYTKPLADNSIEYTRTDAFVEKTISWLKDQYEIIGVSFQEDFLERFKDYMKGE